MEIIQTDIAGLLVLVPKKFSDQRGFFTEVFNASRYAEVGIERPFVQDNYSRSTKGVLRGLHFQNPFPQAKLVTVFQGSVLDVAVDIRIGSPSFGRHFSLELSAENGKQLYVPRGFAHGFLVLSDTADFFYKCDEFYRPQNESSVRWNDPEIDIPWNVGQPILTQRDATAPLLAESPTLPVFEG
jgi:dTDP-4-dehydrorhamnose 3,5-epimerase